MPQIKSKAAEGERVSVSDAEAIDKVRNCTIRFAIWEKSEKNGIKICKCHFFFVYLQVICVHVRIYGAYMCT